MGGPNTTALPSTLRLTHYFQNFDMFRVRDWFLELWSVQAMNKQEHTGRTQPLTWLDYAFDRDSLMKGQHMDYGFQDTSVPYHQDLREFPIVSNPTAKRIALGTSKTKTPLQIFQRDSHITAVTDAAADQSNKTVQNFNVTPWYDMATHKNITNKILKKNLLQTAYNRNTASYSAKTDNYITISYVEYATIDFGFIR